MHTFLFVYWYLDTTIIITLGWIWGMLCLTPTPYESKQSK